MNVGGLDIMKSSIASRNRSIRDELTSIWLALLHRLSRRDNRTPTCRHVCVCVAMETTSVGHWYKCSSNLATHGTREFYQRVRMDLYWFLNFDHSEMSGSMYDIAMIHVL